MGIIDIVIFLKMKYGIVKSKRLYCTTLISDTVKFIKFFSDKIFFTTKQLELSSFQARGKIHQLYPDINLSIHESFIIVENTFKWPN